MNTSTPETDALGREIGKILARQFPLRNTAGMIQRELDECCGKLERERDEARLLVNKWRPNMERSGCLLADYEAAQAELTQLRKVCDELAKCCSNIGYTSVGGW